MKLIRFRSVVGIVAAWCLGLAGLVVQPARADEQSARGDETKPPPPGTSRLIRVGPQALLSEDDQGNLSMAEEPEPPRSRLQVAGIVLGAMTVGVVGAFYGDLRPGVVGAPTYAAAGESNLSR
jgi:hypothetical protein